MDETKPALKKFRPHKITLNDIREGCIRLYGEDNTETELCVSQEELRAGVDFIQKYPRTVTFFGSHILGPETDWYKKAESLSERIVRETGYAVASGGGPGIMEAVNKGAIKGNGQSLGLTIELDGEKPNQYLTDRVDFNFFFNRKTILAYGAEAYIFFPGSYGTFDELFTIILLIATKKIAQAPIVLFGSEFWNGMDAYLRQGVAFGVTPEDYLKLYTVTDDADAVITIIKNASVRLND